MPKPFLPSDLLNYKSVASIAASRTMAACVVGQPDEPGDTNASNIWLLPLDGAVPLLFTTGNHSSPTWSPDGTELAFVSNRGESGLQAYVMCADGGEARAVTQMKGGVISVEWSPYCRRLLFTTSRHVDPSDRGERAERPASEGPQVVWRLPYKLDGNGYKLDKQAFDVQSVRFSPDGTRIADGRTRLGREAPPEETTMPFPFLLDVHSRPQGVAHVEFTKSMWRHVLCSRDWAVLVLNPAGSSSFSLEFMTMLKNIWGENDLPQHLAAIKALQDDGIADDRLAVYGKSYGGYLSAWAIARTDTFRAAVATAPAVP